MKKLQWDKVRVLVANYCNYKCPFCHNEGQDKTTTKERMSLQSFRRLVDILSNQPISEFNISGGEPFLNEDIVDMILYGNDNLDCDISCATNLSLPKVERITLVSRPWICLQKLDVLLRPSNGKWGFKIPAITVFVSLVVRHIEVF